jgi:hypothetical protein
MKKHFAVIASAFAFSLVPVFAQAAPAVDPAVAQAARQMLDAVKMRELMMQTMEQVKQRMPEQIRASATQAIQGDSRLDAEQKRAALAKLEEILPTMTSRANALLADPSLVDDMLSEVVPLYAKTYTLDEIRQLTAFYQSPLGQKMLRTMPRLMGEVMDISHRVMAPRLQKLMSAEASDAANQ